MMRVVCSSHSTWVLCPSSRLFVRHKCSVQGGAYVNYPAFVASFSSAVRRAEPATAIAAVAAAAATTTTIGDSTAASSTQAVGPRRRKGGGREPNRFVFLTVDSAVFW